MPKQPPILIIDDDEPIRDFIRFILERNGYEVLEAANGADAMKIVDAGEVSLVVTDMVMPGQEGVETIAQISKTRPDLRIIAMSGAGNKEVYLQIAQTIGAATVLSKPFTKEALIAAVHKAFSATRKTIQAQDE